MISNPLFPLGGSRARALLVLIAAASVVAGCVAEPPSTTPPQRPSSTIAPSAIRASWITPGTRPGIGGCPLFPDDHAWHATIRSLAVHPRSTSMIRATEDAPLRGGFSAGVWMGSRAGIPVNVVDARVSRRVDVALTESWRTDGGHLGVPLPAEPRFEGWPSKAWDAHLVVVDTSTCESRELLNVRDPSDDVFGWGGGRWFADAAATYTLRSNVPSTTGSTASDASLLAGLIRFDEVTSGNIDHVLSASLPEISSGPPVWPAMDTDGRSKDPNAIPMGSWLRLRANADVSALGPQARVIAAALKDHGAVVSDMGPGFVLRGEPDVRWNDRDIATLRTLSLADFEIVDASPMMVSRSSYQLRR